MNLSKLKTDAEVAKISNVELEIWQMEMSPDDVLRLVWVARLSKELRAVEEGDWPGSRRLFELKRAIDRALNGIEE